MNQPPESTWNWVRETLGDCEIVSADSHLHACSNIWRISNGRSYHWLKMHAQPGKWAGEVYALTHWTPALGLAPTAIAFQPEPAALLLSECPGFEAEGTKLSAAKERAVWSQAGAWLSRLHLISGAWFGSPSPEGAPIGKTFGDPLEFVRERIEQRIKQGVEAQLLTQAEVEFLEFGVREFVPALKGEIPRAIHRDYSPRNWLVGEDENLSAIIDFEHARWDVRAADLNRWWDNEFLRHPELRAAFFEGYGLIDDVLLAQIQALRLAQAVAGVVWATQVGEFAYADLNREALHRMMSESAR